jgi:hypothetical protein
MSLEAMDKHLKEALERIAKPEAFYVATSHVDPEAYARMMYAQLILEGFSLEDAEAEAEKLVRKRYPLR